MIILTFIRRNIKNRIKEKYDFKIPFFVFEKFRFSDK